MKYSEFYEDVKRIYDEADRDIIFLEFLFGTLKFDNHDNVREHDPIKLLRQCLKLIEQMVRRGDFEFYSLDKKIESNLFDNSEELEKKLLALFLRSGEKDFNFSYTLQKIKIGKDIQSDLRGIFILE